MSFGLRELKKNRDSLSSHNHIKVQYFLAGDDPAHYLLASQCEKSGIPYYMTTTFGFEAQKIRSLLDFRPGLLKSGEAQEFFFYKDQKWHSSLSRIKLPFELREVEKYLLSQSTPFDFQLAAHTTFHQTIIESVVRQGKCWNILLSNGDSIDCDHIVWGGDPFKFFSLAEYPEAPARVMASLGAPERWTVLFLELLIPGITAEAVDYAVPISQTYDQGYIIFRKQAGAVGIIYAAPEEAQGPEEQAKLIKHIIRVVTRVLGDEARAFEENKAHRVMYLPWYFERSQASIVEDCEFDNLYFSISQQYFLQGSVNSFLTLAKKLNLS